VLVLAALVIVSSLWVVADKERKKSEDLSDRLQAALLAEGNSARDLSLAIYGRGALELGRHFPLASVSSEVRDRALEAVGAVAQKRPDDTQGAGNVARLHIAVAQSLSSPNEREEGARICRVALKFLEPFVERYPDNEGLLGIQAWVQEQLSVHLPD